MNTTKDNRFMTDYNSAAYQCWSNGQRSVDGDSKSASLFWCMSDRSFKGMRLGFDAEQERDSFVLSNAGAYAIDAPRSGDRFFSVVKNLGPYTCSISF